MHDLCKVCNYSMYIPFLNEELLIPFFLKMASSSLSSRLNNVEKCVIVNWGETLKIYPNTESQFPGRLFSPSDIQKTVPLVFIAFSSWYGFLWLPRKISGCVSLASRKQFFQKGPPFEFIYIFFILRGTLIKKGCL